MAPPVGSHEDELDAFERSSISHNPPSHDQSLRQVRTGATAGGKRPVSLGQKRPRIDFEDFASEIRLSRYHQYRLRLLRSRRDSLLKSVALGARLHRVGSTVQNGLVEISLRADKRGFVRVFHTIQDLKDTCYGHWNGNGTAFDPTTEENAVAPVNRADSVSFISRLSDRSKTDLFDLLHLLRTSSSFLIERIKNLSQAQLLAFNTVPAYQDSHERIPPTNSRGRQASQQKRNVAYSSSVKDYALSFERGNVTSALLFNLYSVSRDSSSQDYILRMSVWSSVCAELYSESEQGYHVLLNEVLHAFASLHGWRAKQKLELFLMNLLQRGAFLLGQIESLPRQQDFQSEVLDPLRTPEAENFFEEAIRELFEILDDQDGGLPFGALHFGSAILGKLIKTEDQSRFRGYLFFQWFFCEYLRVVIVCPENEGMLLQHHVSRNARDGLLYQVWFRAQTKISDMYSDSPHKPVESAMRLHVDNMVSRLIAIDVSDESAAFDSDGRPSSVDSKSSPDAISPAFLVLCASDIMTVLDTLFPRSVSTDTQWDLFLNSSASAFAAQYPQSSSLPYSHSKIAQSEYSQLHEPKGSRLRTSLEANTTLSSNPSSAAFSKPGISRSYEQLRRDLLLVADVGLTHPFTYPVTHPYQEGWSVLIMRSKGFPAGVEAADIHSATIPRDLESPTTQDQSVDQLFRKLHVNDLVQNAAMRLIDEHRTLIRTPRSNVGSDTSPRSDTCLESLFEDEIEMARGRTDSSTAHYWWTALRQLRARYPSSSLARNDTAVLQPMLLASRKAREQYDVENMKLENDLVELNEISNQLKDIIDDQHDRLTELRDKMWYMVDVINSNRYEDAKNVALALNNMALPVTNPALQSSSPGRGRTPPRSFAGSLLQQPQMQTMSIMKAPTEQGGPKKLADEQIELTKDWLQRKGIDNFCRGEERLHRFCLEVKTAAGKLAGETMAENPVLWSSELYSKERALFDISSPRPVTTYNPTRPSSIVSEENLVAAGQTHLGNRILDPPFRLQSAENQNSPGRKSSFHSFASSRATRDPYVLETSSLADSPGRATSATTSESISSFWSPLPTQAQSTASVSSQSRPASTFNDTSGSRTADHMSAGRVRFLEVLRRSLISLLLSDLGAPVWSCGSETDGWLDAIMNQEPVKVRLEKRNEMEHLLFRPPKVTAQEKTAHIKEPRMLRQKRSVSAGPGWSPRTNQSVPSASGSMREPFGSLRMTSDKNAILSFESFSYSDAFQQLINRFCRHTSSTLKLQALYDLKLLAIASLKERAKEKSSKNVSENPRQQLRRSLPPSRRSSLNPSVMSGSQQQEKIQLPEDPGHAGEIPLSERDIVQELKRILLITRPKTLFRDLQFISSFVPSDVLSKTENGKAFLLVGLAALAYKDDVCRSMVDIADKIVVNDVVKRKASDAGVANYTLMDAAQFFIYAAREGNAVAQRELAILYLTLPDHLPIVTLPLSMPRDIFRREMMYWDNRGSLKPSYQAMCLALHWMQNAASNGDEIAKKKLRERDGLDSA